MPRPIKYVTADDLLSNCTIKDECFVWPRSSTPMPMLSPHAPMAREFGTTSVMRILFTICRYIPAGPRLVRWCNNPFCVNPYHHTESKFWRAQRAHLSDPNGLLPEQEQRRHLIAPPDDLLKRMRPIKPEHIRILLDSAAMAGFDAKGVVDKRSYAPPPKPKVRYAEPDQPVLIIKRREEPVLEEPVPDEPEFKFEMHSGDMPDNSGRELDSIFDLIEKRNAATRTQG
jgi:hypothetical protein